MRELVEELLAGEEAWIVGGAVRDELLGRPLVDLDVATKDPQGTARAYARRSGGAPFPLSERHGAWRVALDGGRTVDFTPLRGGIEGDIATRDFTINAIAVPVEGGEPVDPTGGRDDLELGVVRAVREEIFQDDPLRLLRAVRLADELGFRLAPMTEELIRRDAALVTEPAGERILGELERMSRRGFEHLHELGLLEPLGGSLERIGIIDRVDSPDYRLVVVFGERLGELPISKDLARFARALLGAEPPADASRRAIHRFRRATEPWALEALAFLGVWDLDDAVVEARGRDPAEPLVRGDELGLPPGPEIGRLLDLIDEERAAGTIKTREEALELVRREVRT